MRRKDYILSWTDWHIYTFSTSGGLSNPLSTHPECIYTSLRWESLMISSTKEGLKAHCDKNSIYSTKESAFLTPMWTLTCDLQHSFCVIKVVQNDLQPDHITPTGFITQWKAKFSHHKTCWFFIRVTVTVKLWKSLLLIVMRQTTFCFGQICSAPWRAKKHLMTLFNLTFLSVHLN